MKILFIILYIAIMIIFGGILKYRNPKDYDSIIWFNIAAIWPISLMVVIIIYTWEIPTNYIKNF